MIIVTDSAADLLPVDIKNYNIQVVPLSIEFPEGSVTPAEISPDEFYNRLEAMFPKIPTTSQPSAGIFQQAYQNLLTKGEQILSIHISSGLSGTIQSAQNGANQTGQSTISVWDSMTLSAGQRFQVLAAAQASRLGWNSEKILDRLKEIRAKAELIYTLDTLEYLQHGGRIGRVQALAGALLHIKPIIEVDKSDGKYSTIGKARTIKRALSSMVDTIRKRYGTQEPLWVTVMHGQFASQAEALAKLIQQECTVAKIETARISPVLGVHTGPAIVGVGLVPMRLMSDMEFPA